MSKINKKEKKKKKTHTITTSTDMNSQLIDVAVL